MPKRILLIAFAVTALALAACNSGYNPEDLYGTPVPTTATPSETPNPTITAAVVTVTVSSSPLPDQPINLYTDSNGSLGTLITTQKTGSSGQTTFTDLKAAANYCFETSYTPTAPGSLTQIGKQCTDLWFAGITFAF
jgi:hypothetical protein